MKNPLRYPGGKSFLAKYIGEVIKCNDLTNCTIVEPYAGSAAVSLYALANGLVRRAVLIEKDPLIYSFWKSVFDHTNVLCAQIDDLDVSIEAWHSMVHLRNVITPLEYPTPVLGLAGLFFNRANYSGILKANPIGGKSQSSVHKIDCRFNKTKIIKSIQRISAYRDSVDVVWADAISYLRVNRRMIHENRSFVYADPPYYEKGKGLYRYYYKEDDHIELAGLLKSSLFPWLLSYDNHPAIHSLYLQQDNRLNRQQLYSDYSAQKHRLGAELLISNIIIPPIDAIKMQNQEIILNA